MDKLFDGKVALVTGAAAGIGRATALAFARAGAKVGLSDVDEAGGRETLGLIEREGGQSHFVRADIANPEDVRKMVMQVSEALGGLHVAVNNAGIGGPMARVVDYSEEDWRRVLAVNLDGVFHCLKYEVPELLRGGGGAIVNVGSILGSVAFAMAPAYVASKHGLIGLTRSAAVEYAAQGIRVNAVSPGFIETPMIQKAGIVEGSDMHRMIVEKHPIGRLGKPQEVAEAILWLCSDKASFVTGASLLVDGGYTAV